jgi:hypothetical protein
MTALRDVVVGKNARLWKAMCDRPDVKRAKITALGHADLHQLTTLHNTRVWILSYSRNAEENAALFRRLKELLVSEAVYISTATSNVAALTQCYGYPSVKARAETQAADILAARIARIGVVYSDKTSLPSGIVAATPLDDLCALITGRHKPNADAVLNLFTLHEKPFASGLESLAFRLYGALHNVCRPWPCVLRPVDLVCKLLGWNWYGYLYLSNRQWILTTSSSAQA